MRWQRWALSVSLALLGVMGLLVAPLADGHMPVSVTVNAERIGSVSHRKAIYRISATAGASGASFGFEYVIPGWPGRGGHIAGSPIVVNAIRLVGVGSIRPAALGPVPPPSLPRRNTCHRGQRSTGVSAYWVEIAPNATVVVELEGKGSYPAWTGTEYGVAFSTFAADDPFATRSPLARAATPPLMPKGTNIQMELKKDAARSGLEVIGRTSPPLPMARIILRAVRPTREGSVYLRQWSARSSVLLGAARTNRQGRFHLSPLAIPSGGRYALLARSEKKGARVADWNCGPFFEWPERIPSRLQ